MPEPTHTAKSYRLTTTLKEDTSTLVASIPLASDDEFSGLYQSTRTSKAQVIQPTFNPLTLRDLVYRNNILAQCVDAMEVCVGGTGDELRLDPEEPDAKDDEAERKRLSLFLKTPYPLQSWRAIKRRMVRDREEVGGAYLEFLRNVKGELKAVRRLDPVNMRLVELSEPMLDTVEFLRGEEKVTVTMYMRYRRFAQIVGNEPQYFKEYGCPHDVHRITGEFATKEQPIPAKDLASEVLYWPLVKDVNTPYGVPRWINQTPSVLGSRKAEEYNVSLLDAGGVPPVWIFVSGGALSTEAAATMNAVMNDPTSKQRGVVTEIMSASGSIDSAGKVDVRVERFGDTGKDAMFKGYDKSCEDHVRVAFRLPPLFVGLAAEVNLANAIASYVVSEAQVFTPERETLDELINNTLMKELQAKTYEYRSLPLTLADVATQLKALELVKDKVAGEHFVESINDVSGLDLVYDEKADPSLQQQAADQKAQEEQAKALAEPKQPPTKPVLEAVKSEVVTVVDDVLKHQGLEDGAPRLTLEDIDSWLGQVSKEEADEFKEMLAHRIYRRLGDVEGLGQIAGCVAAYLA